MGHEGVGYKANRLAINHPLQHSDMDLQAVVTPVRLAVDSCGGGGFPRVINGVHEITGSRHNDRTDNRFRSLGATTSPPSSLSRLWERLPTLAVGAEFDHPGRSSRCGLGCPTGIQDQAVTMCLHVYAPPPPPPSIKLVVCWQRYIRRARWRC